jgi:hypothetical protein
MLICRIVTRRICATLFAALAMQMLCSGGVSAQDARASLNAELEFFNPMTRRPVRPETGKPFGLRVALTDATTGRAPRNLILAGWIRTQSSANASCEAAAQAFRVTAQPPLGSVDLNGILVVTLNEDASVGVIDPKLNLQSSNMIAAANLEKLPFDMAVDPTKFQAFFVTGGQSGLTSLSLLTGEQARHFEAEPDLSSIVSGDSSGLWVGRTDGEMFSFDDPNVLHHVGSGAVSLRASAEPDSTLLAGFASERGLVVLDGATGVHTLELPLFEALFDLTLLRDGSVIALPRSGNIAKIVYPDAPNYAVEIPLGFRARRIVASPGGRHAIAYAPGEPAAVVIDVARGEVVQPLELADSVLTEVTFTDDTAYLLSLDGGFAGLIDLNSVALGKPAQIRKIDLARKSHKFHEGGGLLVPLWPSPQVIAVSPETQTGWLLNDKQAVGEMPPMDSIRLRGGVPSRVAIIDRSFRETVPGVFETVALVQGGDHELVLTTGIGGMTACIGFRVRGVSDTQETELISLSVDLGGDRFVAGEEVEIAVTFRDSAGVAIPVESAQFMVPSLSSSWVGRMTARRAPDGSLRGSVRFPHPGPFALQPVALPKYLYLKSAILIEVPS